MEGIRGVAVVEEVGNKEKKIVSNETMCNINNMLCRLYLTNLYDFFSFKIVF